MEAEGRRQTGQLPGTSGSIQVILHPSSFILLRDG